MLEVERLCGRDEDNTIRAVIVDRQGVMYTDPEYEEMEYECDDESRPEHGTRRSSMKRKTLLQATTRAGGDLNPVVALALGMRMVG